MNSYRLSQLCEILDQHGFRASLEGEDLPIKAINTLESASAGELSFLSNEKYLKAVAETDASAIICKDGVSIPPGKSAIRIDDPYAALAVAIIALYGYRRHPQWGVSDRANIHETAQIGSHLNIAAGATIAEGAVLGDNCTIYPGCYIAKDARIGHDCTLFPNVVIYDGCVLGDRCTIHAGSVIGQDGLGFAPHEGKWVKIPQIGNAVLGDDVEIGANCSIDRATLGSTEVHSGTKFSDNVTIGHGCKIGEHCLFVGQVGLAGSVNVGRHVTLAGQVGLAGHQTIGDHAVVAAQAGVVGDLEGGKTYFGSPAVPITEAHRSHTAMRKLPQWFKRIKALEKEVAELRKLTGAEKPLS
ncbi:MAG: UDP-3-O-(3-hydroxymyristoyl)glucosamine N-acyltransferase [Phycisphaerae bacterium]